MSVWNLHTAFRTPGVIVPQFVEMTDGEKFFTLAEPLKGQPIAGNTGPPPSDVARL